MPHIKKLQSWIATESDEQADVQWHSLTMSSCYSQYIHVLKSAKLVRHILQPIRSCDKAHTLLPPD